MHKVESATIINNKSEMENSNIFNEIHKYFKLLGNYMCYLK